MRESKGMVVSPVCNDTESGLVAACTVEAQLTTAFAGGHRCLVSGVHHALTDFAHSYPQRAEPGTDGGADWGLATTVPTGNLRFF